jgi:hypothetical protein
MDDFNGKIHKDMLATNCSFVGTETPPAFAMVVPCSSDAIRDFEALR